MRITLAVLAALLLALPTSAVAADNTVCEAVRCEGNTQQALSQCPCPEAENHGRYVSCVAHAVNKLAKDDAIPTNCKGKIKRCAARSTCGKPGFVTCNIPRFGTCDLASSTCSEGTTTQLDGLCDSDTDCVTEIKCKIKSSADRCTAVGGSVGTGTSCCPDCAG